MRMVENVSYQLLDANKNIKKIFEPNRLFLWLMKKGVVTPHFRKIPFILGQWTNSASIANLVTNAGKAGVAGRINGVGSVNAFDYIALGTGTTAAALGDTTLETEITTGGGARAQGTASRTTTDVTNDTARVVNTFSFTASFAVTESGVLNAASSGDLLCRQVFSAINVANGDSLQVTWDVDVD